MPRPHIEFLRSQAMPWQTAGGQFARPLTEFKVLSADALSGACTLLVRYPKGWSMRYTQHITCDEEFFLLSGALEINEQSYTQGDYAFLPAYYQRHKMRAVEESLVLAFFEGTPEHRRSVENIAVCDNGKTIERLSTSCMTFGSASDARIADKAVTRLVLKPDSIDGDRTWILQVSATEESPFEVNGIEQHPCIEEVFVLDGDIVMECGKMCAGDYLWRPPMIKHGPMGTKNGFVGLFRAKEGSFDTIWSDADDPIDWNAAYKPTLPPDHQTVLGLEASS